MKDIREGEIQGQLFLLNSSKITQIQIFCVEIWNQFHS
jgi:hypothetical protein